MGNRWNNREEKGGGLSENVEGGGRGKLNMRRLQKRKEGIREKLYVV